MFIHLMTVMLILMLMLMMNDDADGDDDDDVDCDGRRGHSEAFIPLALPAIAAWSSGQAATTAGNIMVTMTVMMVMVKMMKGIR